MDARVGLEIERLTHFVEARRNAALLEAIVDEQQQFALFRGEHRPSLPTRTNGERVLNKRARVKPVPPAYPPLVRSRVFSAWIAASLRLTFISWRSAATNSRA